MAAVTPTTAKIDLTTNPRRHRKDVAARWMFRLGAWTTFLVTVLIILTLVVDAWDFLSKLARRTRRARVASPTSAGSRGGACTTSPRW